MHFSTLVSRALLTSLAAAYPGRINHRPYGNCGSITAAYAKEVVSQFETDQIIPDLIEANVFNTPTVEVNVAYGTKAVNLGTYFSTAETLEAPTLNFTAEKGYDPYTTKYMYFLVDPDVPFNGAPGTQMNFNHWTVYNAQPECVTTQDPTTVTVYEPLTPASETQHGYTFLVYREPEGFDLSLVQEALLNIRTPFDLNDFTQDNNLVAVGGNFLKEAIDNGLQG